MYKVTVYLFNLFSYFCPCCVKGAQNFGGITVRNGPTDDQAEIIQHDQLEQQTEEEHEVKETCPRHDGSCI